MQKIFLKVRQYDRFGMEICGKNYKYLLGQLVSLNVHVMRVMCEEYFSFLYYGNRSAAPEKT